MNNPELAEILLQKISNLDERVSGYVELSGQQWKRINEDIEELKKITKSTETQAIKTNSRVTKIEDKLPYMDNKIQRVETFQEHCPLPDLENKLKFFLFFREHYKVLLPSVGALLGALLVVYTLLMAFVERING
jgi:hypothetical protein